MYNKFIITDSGHLRFGQVYMHRDLLDPGEDCLGGGLWKIDEEKRCVLLFGRSFDFGGPDFSEVRLIEWGSLHHNSPSTMGAMPLYYAPHFPALEPLEPVFAKP